MTIRYYKRDLLKTRFSSNTFCFTNDLCTINEHLKFDRNFKKIHPSELQLKKKSTSTSEASFVKLSIIIEYKKFKTQLYDKRDTFPFSIVRMSHLDSYIPLNIYYTSISSEIVGFVRTTSEINAFVTLSNGLLKKMQKQGSKHRSIISMLKKIFGKHFVFNTFADKKTNFIKRFLAS